MSLHFLKLNLSKTELIIFPLPHASSPDFSVRINSTNINPSLPTIQCLLPLSANPSTDLHSVSSTPLCQSLHWPSISVLHPSLPIPPLTTIQCPPPLSANPSTSFHSVSSTPLCQSLHRPPFSVLHPSLPIPPLAFNQCPPPLSANPSTGLHSVSSTPLCQSLH
ncbi:unnamed protein product [Staurois parvus]|uniref:Uncharacterized protein n=1 Tax=Staurois parvus TaxID=386267 RepID=A0ABN9BIR5_9NEOB|nr:unnamed protein product [Staurois parvus]